MGFEGLSSAAGSPDGGDRGLRIESISISDFRNFESFSLDGLGPLTILVGPNAVGKTSVVEAVQMMTALRSFRTNQYAQMIRWGADSASVDALVAGGGRLLELSLRLKDGKRTYGLNGKSKRVQDLKGVLPAVSFSPDDLNLVKGSNSNRRDAVDALGSQLSKNFYSVKSDYAKLVRQRNRALKDGVPDAYIDSIDDVLVLVASQLMAHRLHILRKMTPAFAGYYHDIAAGGESLCATYIPSWDESDDCCGYACGIRMEDGFDKSAAADMLAAALKRRRAEERARGKTVVGPHADKLTFLLDGRDALHYSSQGQQRSIVLAFKLAEAAVITETLGQKPILLLDDVLSELDELRRRYFLQFISDDLQTFITTTNAECLSPEVRAKANMIHLDAREGGLHGQDIVVLR